MLAAPLVHGHFLISAQRLNAFLLLVGDGEIRRQRQIAKGGDGLDEGIALEELPEALAETGKGTLRLLRAGRGLLLGRGIVGRLGRRIGREGQGREEKNRRHEKSLDGHENLRELIYSIKRR